MRRGRTPQPDLARSSEIGDKLAKEAPKKNDQTNQTVCTWIYLLGLFLSKDQGGREKFIFVAGAGAGCSGEPRKSGWVIKKRERRKNFLRGDGA